MTFKRPVKIAPSLLSADFSQLEVEIAKLNPGITDYLHLDIMDGRFVPNITFGPMIVETVSKLTTIPLDTHLMIVEPQNFISAFAKAGSQIITVHAETCPHLQRTLQSIRDLGKRAGVSLNPATPLSVIENVLPDLDLVLLMTVNPGFGGQKFIPQMIDKIKICRKMIEDYPIELEVDGGIKLENIDQVYAAGAHVFVSGSGVFGRPPYNETIQAMKDKL